MDQDDIWYVRRKQAEDHLRFQKDIEKKRSEINLFREQAAVTRSEESSSNELLQEVKKLKQESLKKKDKPLLSAHVVVKTGGAKGGIVKKEKVAKAKAGLHSSAPPHATTTATTSVQSTAPDTDDAPGSAGANLDLIETISASSARQPAGHVNLLGTSYSSSSDGEED